MSEVPVEDLLRKVLLLEIRQAFGNRAMAGGLSAFARGLHTRSGANSPVPQAALHLENYDTEDLGRRKASVKAALHALEAQVGPSRADVARGSPQTRPTKEPQSGRPAARRPSRPAETKVSVDAPVNALSGVGAKLAATLATAGVSSIRDLLYYFPREHLDYRRQDRIRSLAYGQRTTILATVELVRVRHVRKTLSITTAIVSDESGRISVNWFNQPYLEKTLQPGRKLAITGEAELFDGKRTFSPRDYELVDERELVHAARLVPIYPLTKGLRQKSLRTVTRRAVDSYAGSVLEIVPEYLRREFSLPPLAQSIASYHFPEDEDQGIRARQRLAFDELLSIQLGLQSQRRKRREECSAPRLAISDVERGEFVTKLPFALTNAQQRVMAELEASLAQTQPMSRLVQGDVGSGKTVVAALAVFIAAQGGHQGVIMAPTEILARQHFGSLSTWLEPLGVSVGLLVGSTRAKERAEVLARCEAGELDVLVGTHALFQEGVSLARLGVAVVDEQHRFGVAQRSCLRDKGRSPHLLAMTATPIPRTLQLTLYGDLDISIIDELPPGRVPVETRLVESVSRAYRLVSEQMALGRQAFVVCPVIDESADDDVKSVIAEHRRLTTDIFTGLKVGLLHGRLGAKEKDRVLAAFRDGRYQVLVATTLVEVGIDVPNATVMVIRDAHRFGLAQLHQLRGRIGRGAEKSHCVLVSPASVGETYERLQAVVASHDGFVLAEKDLELRGPGEYWGTRQSGLPELKVAGLGDLPILEKAKAAATLILERDNHLEAPEHLLLSEQVGRLWKAEPQLH